MTRAARGRAAHTFPRPPPVSWHRDACSVGRSPRQPAGGPRPRHAPAPRARPHTTPTDTQSRLAQRRSVAARTPAARPRTAAHPSLGAPQPRSRRAAERLQPLFHPVSRPRRGACCAAKAAFLSCDGFRSAGAVRVRRRDGSTAREMTRGGTPAAGATKRSGSGSLGHKLQTTEFDCFRATASRWLATIQARWHGEHFVRGRV